MTSDVFFKIKTVRLRIIGLNIIHIITVIDDANNITDNTQHSKHLRESFNLFIIHAFSFSILSLSMLYHSK